MLEAETRIGVIVAEDKEWAQVLIDGLLDTAAFEVIARPDTRNKTIAEIRRARQVGRRVLLLLDGNLALDPDRPDSSTVPNGADAIAIMEAVEAERHANPPLEIVVVGIAAEGLARYGVTEGLEADIKKDDIMKRLEAILGEIALYKR